MVFEFAKTILKSKDLNVTDVRFGECDVWAVLNYLGKKWNYDNFLSFIIFNHLKHFQIVYKIKFIARIYN